MTDDAGVPELRVRNAAAPLGRSVERPSATVVVLAYNSAEVIGGCLSALREQDFDEPFETVVVWSGDTRIPELVARACPRATVVGQLDRLPTGAGRNLGIRSTSGEIVVFLAADCRPAPDWLRRRAAAHRSGFRCVGGTVLLGEPAGAVARANHLLEYSECMPGRPRQEFRGRSVNNLSFDRQIFAEYGMYEPGLACGEDTVFSARLAFRGEPMLFDPGIRISHPGPRTLREFAAHHVWHGAAYAKIIRDHGYGSDRYAVKVPRVAIFVRYPAMRLWGLARRLLSSRRDLLGEALFFSPILVLGVAACMVGIAREWWGEGSAT